MPYWVQLVMGSYLMLSLRLGGSFPFLLGIPGGKGLNFHEVSGLLTPGIL